MLGYPYLRKPPVHFIWESCENLAHPLPDLAWPLQEPGSCRRKKPKRRWLQPSKKAAEPGNLPCRGQSRWVTLTFWRFMLDPKPQDRVVSDDLWVHNEESTRRIHICFFSRSPYLVLSHESALFVSYSCGNMRLKREASCTNFTSYTIWRYPE